MAAAAPEGSQFDAGQYDDKKIFLGAFMLMVSGIVLFCKGLDVIQQAQSGTGKTATFECLIVNAISCITRIERSKSIASFINLFADLPKHYEHPVGFPH
ncbi:hypothetical protein V6N11_031895 [Hibiscus sabdariffa]|uniref:Uncharacterized protein n=1 Tax=Hibiscus sabdariffa TaxID=183260 RepID=A0ABR2SYY7_9ROSI